MLWGWGSRCRRIAFSWLLRVGLMMRGCGSGFLGIGRIGMSSWRTVEELVEVWDVIESKSVGEGRVVVLDCLTLWLNNLMLEERDVEGDVESVGFESLEEFDGASP